MRVKLELDPDVDDQAPDGPDITVYDEAHFVTYLRLLDAERDGAHWTEVARIVLHRDPDREELKNAALLRQSHDARAMDDESAATAACWSNPSNERVALDPDRQNFRTPPISAPCYPTARSR